jgi:hypothetical protein
MSAGKPAVLLQLHTALMNLKIGVRGKDDTYRLRIIIGLYFFLSSLHPFAFFSLFIGFQLGFWV